MDEFLRGSPEAHADAPEVLYLAFLEEGEAQQTEGGIIYRLKVFPPIPIPQGRSLLTPYTNYAYFKGIMTSGRIS
mgnify:CR=1 FL=1